MFAADKKKATGESARAARASRPQATAATPAQTGLAFNPIWQLLATGPGILQAKLAVSDPDDPHEREADHVADQVMRSAAPVAIHESNDDAQIQRQTPDATGGSPSPPNLLKIYSFGPTGAGRVERESGTTIFSPPAPVDANGRELVRAGTTAQPILSRFGRYFTVDERERPQIPPSQSDVGNEIVWRADDGSQQWRTSVRFNTTYYAPGEPLGTPLGSEYILRNDRPGVFSIWYVLANSVSPFLIMNHEVHYVNEPTAPPGATVLAGRPGPPPPPSDNGESRSAGEETSPPEVQRKCAGCEDDEEKDLQRKKDGTVGPAVAPQTVSSGLNSSGQPLDPDTRTFMEQRMNHDFGDVRVHTDQAAGDSARSLNALAFTLNRNVVFAPGQYRPRSESGRRLLAHELAHVVQQRSHGQGYSVIQRQLPGLAQGPHDTCQPASMLTALIVRDRDRADPANPNGNMVGICNAALIYMHQNRDALVAQWSTHGADGARRYTDSVARVTAIRNDLRRSGSTVTQSHYEDLAVILSEFGRSSDAIMRHLHLAESSSSHPAESFDAIFSDPLMTGLAPGQVNQIEWYVRTTMRNITTGEVTPTSGYHMFLIGRRQTGEWYVSDQGRTPPYEETAPDLATLRQRMVAAEASGRSWIITSPAMRRILLTWSGVHRVANQDFSQPHIQLAPPGTFLAEIDAGWTVTGERISTWDFVGIAYSLTDAGALFPPTGTGHGFLVGEMPSGVFNVWKTTPVSTDNMAATGIDAGDSAGGLLVRSPAVFLHAWLHLRTSSTPISGIRPFAVY